MSRWKRCNNPSANNAQEKGDRRKRTSDLAWTQDLHSFAELQPHELSVPVTNPSSPIALCSGRRCAAIQWPLEDLRLKAGTVCDSNGLISPEQCLQRGYYNVSTCSQRTWTSMARQRQLTPSTTGSWVHATRCRPLSPLPSHTVPASRRRSSSGHCTYTV